MHDFETSLFKTTELTSQGGWEAYAKLSALREVGLWPFFWEVVDNFKRRNIPVVFTTKIGSTEIGERDKGLFVVEFAGTDDLSFEKVIGTDSHSYLDLTMVYNFDEGQVIGNKRYSSNAGEAITARAFPRGQVIVFHGTHELETGVVFYEGDRFRSGPLNVHTEGPANMELRRLLEKFPPLQTVTPFNIPIGSASKLTVLE